jgi:hypothetical protein
MTPIIMADPNAKVSYPFTTVEQVGFGLQQGYIPIRADGTPMKVQQFEGGFLFDGAPINVWLGLGWYTGQKELLLPFWQSGQIPMPPPNILNADIVPMPAQVEAQWETYHAGQQSILGLPFLLLR